jgi:hypothetical protein
MRYFEDITCGSIWFCPPHGKDHIRDWVLCVRIRTLLVEETQAGREDLEDPGIRHCTAVTCKYVALVRRGLFTIWKARGIEYAQYGDAIGKKVSPWEDVVYLDPIVTWSKIGCVCTHIIDQAYSSLVFPQLRKAVSWKCATRTLGESV